MTFKEWVLRHEGKNSPLGDLASDVSRDETFPEENTREAILNHLTDPAINACPEAVDTFKRAWSSYRAYEKKHSE